MSSATAAIYADIAQRREAALQRFENAKTKWGTMAPAQPILHYDETSPAPTLPQKAMLDVQGAGVADMMAKLGIGGKAANVQCATLAHTPVEKDALQTSKA